MVQEQGVPQPGADMGSAPKPKTAFTADVLLPGECVMLTSGVILRLRQPSTWAVTEVVRQMAAIRPQPPILHDPDRGRDEPNEADPDYQAALRAHEDRELERKYEVVIATGTTVEHVPADVPGMDDPAWLEMLAALGIPQPAEMTPSERYIRWVKYVAAPAQEDWLMLVTGLRPRVGTPEEAVATAASTFRSDAERGTD